MAKFLSNINLETANDIQFKTTAGANAGKISQTGDDLVISNAVGDILLGNGSDDIYIGDGTNTVDIRFEQNMSIFADSSSTRTLTLGGANTSLVLDSPAITGTITDNTSSLAFLSTAQTFTGQKFFDAGFEAHPIMLSGSQNFDNIDRSGFYNLYNTSSGSTNPPPNGAYGTMFVIGNDKQSQGFGVQLFHQRTGGAGQLQVRGMNDTGSTWTSWNTVYTSADTAAIADGGTGIATADQIHTFVTGLGYLTDYTVTQGDVTAHQAALSITQSQISDFGNDINEKVGNSIYLRNYELSTGSGGGSFLIGKIEHSSSTDGAISATVHFSYDYGTTTNNCTLHFNFAQRSGTARGTWWYEADDQDAANDRVHARLIDDGSGNMYVWITCADYSVAYVEARHRFSSNFPASGTLTAATITSGTTLFDTANNPTAEIHVGNVFAHGELEATSLDINGNADISGNLTGVDTLTATTLFGNHADGSGLSLKLGRSDNSNYWEFNHAGNDLRIYNTASSGSHILLGVDASGNAEANNVGIGTAVPDQKLHVVGNFNLDGNADISGNLVLGGDLTVNGTTVTVDTTNLNVQDKNITLNYSTSDSSASADGAGITIQDAVDSSTDATILWDATNDEFDFSHAINVTGAITSSGQITGTELEGTSLDINGNADISGTVSTGVLTATGLKSPYLETNSNASLFLRPNGSGHVYLGDSGNGTHLYHYSNDNDGVYSTFDFNSNYYRIRTDATSGVWIHDPLRVDGAVDINGNTDIAGTLSLDDTLTVNHATGTSQLFLTGTGNGYVNAAVVLQCNDDNGHTRGAGVYMNNVVGETEWFAGRPYSDGDSYKILRRHTTSGNHNNSTADPSTTNTTAVMDIDSNGNVVFSGEVEGASLDINGNADISGNITVGGTVDGVDIATLQPKPSEGAFADGDKTKLDGIATSANNYVHPTNAGNKHIPAGGASGNFLKYSSAGTAVWSTPTKSDVGLGNVSNVDQTNASNITSGTLAASRVATLNQNTTGSAASLSGLSLGDIVAGGESGYTTVSGNTASSNKFLRSRGAASTATIPAFETIGASDISGLGSLATASTISNSNWSGTDLSVANGGTGRSSLSSGQVLLGNGTSGINTRAIGISDDNIVEIDSLDVASGEYARFTANGLESRSTSEVLSDIGAQASGNYITGSGSLSAQNITDIGNLSGTNTGDVCTTNHANAGYLTSVATSNIADNAVTFAKMQDMTRGSIIAANNLGHPAELTIGSNGQVLKADANGDIVWANESGGTAGTLIDISSGTINVDLTEATAATIADGDFILFLDGGTNSSAAKGDIHDVANLFAGTGLTATDSVISVNLGNGLAMDGTNISINLDGSTLALGQNGIKVGATQDTIQTIYNTNLIVGRASTDMAIEFNTADQVDVTHNGTTVARFDNDGDLFLSRDWHIGHSFSDIKLKENIKDFENGLDAVLQLKPVTFDWKDKERGSNHTGFIAQEVEKIIPNAVKKRKKLEDNDLNEYLSIDNSQIIATLTKAVQEQQKQINELKEIINGISK